MPGKTSHSAMKSAYRKMKERRQQQEQPGKNANDISNDEGASCNSAKPTPYHYNFDEMYATVIARDCKGDDRERRKLERFGGKEKLRELLFPSEEILAMSSGMNNEEGMFSQLLSDDALFITNKRLLYIQSKPLGMLVHEFSLKKIHVTWGSYGHKMTIASLGDSLTVYLNKNNAKKIKEVLYDLDIA